MLILKPARAMWTRLVAAVCCVAWLFLATPSLAAAAKLSPNASDFSANARQLQSSLITNSNSVKFSSTGAAQSYTVPAGTSWLQVDACGGNGGGGGGGRGGYIRSLVPVSGGQTLLVYVGKSGANNGWNGGGFGNRYGGGSSDIRLADGTTKLAVAAGGGGDDSGSGSAGAGGGLTGQAGQYSTASGNGGGGSQTAGGAGGSSYGATAGSLGQGGACTSGGGGGGGYYGGGGGYWDGGGGSSYTISTGIFLINTQGDSRCNGDGVLYVTAFVASALPVSYYPSSTYPTGFTLFQGNLVGVVALPAVYTVSVDVMPAATGSDWHNIAVLTGNGDIGWTTGWRLPNLEFCNPAGNNGFACPSNGLGVAMSYQGSSEFTWMAASSTQSLPLNAWSTLTGTIDAVNLIMTLTVSGAVAISTRSTSFPTPSQTTWPSVQVWASDATPLASKIRNLVISLPPAALPVSYYPSSSYPTGFTLIQGNLVGVVALPAVYTVSVDVMPTSDGTDWRSILHLTALPGVDHGQGSRLPGMWFCNGGSCPTLGVHIEYEGTSVELIQTTQALPLNAWSTITVMIDNANKLMTRSVSGGITVAPQSVAINPSQSTWPSVQVYASDLFYSAGSANIRNSLISVRSAAPSPRPTALSTLTPTAIATVPPSPLPSAIPSAAKTNAPTAATTARPTWSPSSLPTALPSPSPSAFPSAAKTNAPTAATTARPTWSPSSLPTALPSAEPSAFPSAAKTNAPTAATTTQPTTLLPTLGTTPKPSPSPSALPSASPTTAIPSCQPTPAPTFVPTVAPSPSPTAIHSPGPSPLPDGPSARPTLAPSCRPTPSPTGQPSAQPSRRPTTQPTNPTSQPSSSPTCPTSQPSGQPSRVPTSPPTASCKAGHFINQASSAGSSLTACQRCAKGRYSSGINSHKCDLCKPGSYAALTGQSSCNLTVAGMFTPVVGSFSPETCSPGTYSGATSASSCQPCLPGSFAGQSGATKCQLCAVAYYSSGRGATACQQCPEGRSTPLPGATSDSQCLSPINNFVMGGLTLLLAAVTSVAYIILGGFHFTAFVRRERVVGKQVDAYKKLIKDVDESETLMSDSLWHEKVKTNITKKIKDLREINGDRKWGSIFCDFVVELTKSLLFIPLAVLTVLVVTTCAFLALLAVIFFHSLIIWRHSQSFIRVSDYGDVVKHFMSLLFSVLNGFVPPAFLDILRVLFDLLDQAFRLLSNIRIDLSAVGVTCVGASAPFQLIINLIVLGVVVTIIESELQVFRLLTFSQAMERYTTRLLSTEYRKFSLTFNSDTGIKRCKELLIWEKMGWYGFYFVRLAGLAAVQGLFVLLNFNSLLQFALTLVQIKPFAADKGLHAYSETCNHSPKWENFDTYLAHGSSFVAYSLILPIVYEMSRILCPMWGIEDTERSPGTFRKNLVDKKRLTLERRHSLSSKPADTDRSVFRLLWSLKLTAWLRLPVTLVAPDLLLSHLTRMLVDFLQIKKAVAGGVNHAESVPNPLLPGGEVQKSMENESAARKAFKHSEGSIIVKSASHLLQGFVSSAIATLRPLEQDEVIAWQEEENAVVMPSYYGLVREELYSLLGERFRNNGLLSHALSIILVICPIGHVLTSIGLFFWSIVLKKYLAFVGVSLGIWTTSAYRAYDIEGKTEKFGCAKDDKEAGSSGSAAADDHDNERSLMYSACLSATVASRAILLQLVPQLTIWSIFSIATAGYPIFVGSQGELFTRLAQPFLRNFIHEARKVEKYKYNTEPRGWIILLSGLSMFFLESRAISFLFNAYMVFISVFILIMPPTKIIIASAVFILLPIAIAHALRIVVLLGRALNVKDPAEIFNLSARSKTTRRIIELLKKKNDDGSYKNPSDDEIVEELKQKRKVEIKKSRPEEMLEQGYNSMSAGAVKSLRIASSVLTLTATHHDAHTSSAYPTPSSEMGRPSDGRIPRGHRPSFLGSFTSALGVIGFSVESANLRDNQEEEQDATSFEAHRPGASQMQFTPANLPHGHVPTTWRPSLDSSNQLHYQENHNPMRPSIVPAGSVKTGLLIPRNHAPAAAHLDRDMDRHGGPIRVLPHAPSQKAAADPNLPSLPRVPHGSQDLQPTDRGRL